MYLSGEGGPADPVPAARWFNLAAHKGHVGSEAMLGKILFDSGKTVKGLSILDQGARTRRTSLTFTGSAHCRKRRSRSRPKPTGEPPWRSREKLSRPILD
jgi:TPR repeat protein